MSYTIQNRDGDAPQAQRYEMVPRFVVPGPRIPGRGLGYLAQDEPLGHNISYGPSGELLEWNPTTGRWERAELGISFVPREWEFLIKYGPIIAVGGVLLLLALR